MASNYPPGMTDRELDEAMGYVYSDGAVDIETSSLDPWKASPNVFKFIGADGKLFNSHKEAQCSILEHKYKHAVDYSSIDLEKAKMLREGVWTPASNTRERAMYDQAMARGKRGARMQNKDWRNVAGDQRMTKDGVLEVNTGTEWKPVEDKSKESYNLYEKCIALALANAKMKIHIVIPSMSSRDEKFKEFAKYVPREEAAFCSTSMWAYFKNGSSINYKSAICDFSEGITLGAAHMVILDEGCLHEPQKLVDKLIPTMVKYKDDDRYPLVIVTTDTKKSKDQLTYPKLLDGKLKYSMWAKDSIT